MSDSLPLPRREPEVCEWQDTWPYLLRKDGYDVYSVSIGGATVAELLEQLDYHNSREKDIAIIQTGIVDAAPRILTKEERTVINYFWLSRKLLLPLILRFKTYLRKKRNMTYTSRNDFRTALKDIRERIGCEKVYAIGILPPVHGYEGIAPGISENIKAYNSILAEVFNDAFLDVDNMPSEGIMSDFHHLNAAGHRFVYNIVKMRIGS